jgi:hypothetical protein
VKFWVYVVGLTPPPPNQHVFLVSNFFNLAILVGEKMEKIVQIQGKTCQKIGYEI